MKQCSGNNECEYQTCCSMFLSCKSVNFFFDLFMECFVVADFLNVTCVRFVFTMQAQISN